jgi:hypothetical protein
MYFSSADGYDDLVDRYYNNVHFINSTAQLIRDLILFRLPTSVHSQSTILGAFATRSLQVVYEEKKRIQACRNYQWLSTLGYYSPYFFRNFLRYLRELSLFMEEYGSWILPYAQQRIILELKQIEKNELYNEMGLEIQHKLLPSVYPDLATIDDRYKSIYRSSSDRYDDLVDRYHNNVHFMNYRAQFIRDLILFRLPTSVHSQSTMLGAFAARSSQVDYGERKQIEDFCRKYQSSSALDYYTKDSFYHRGLNSALRQQPYNIIYQYRHAIIDVIKCLRKLPPFRDKTGSRIFHRGQQMTIFELEKMKNNVGELVSCSSFLSTSLNPQIAEIFAGDGSDDNPCLVSVIFQIRLDTNQPMRPYARIETSFEEEEVLFSPGTRFCLMSCRKLHDNGRLWLFELVAISEKQQEQLILNHGETFLLLSSARGWPVRSWLFII